EDGIRDSSVTGVQTCALPISPCARANSSPMYPVCTVPGLERRPLYAPLNRALRCTVRYPKISDVCGVTPCCPPLSALGGLGPLGDLGDLSKIVQSPRIALAKRTAPR